MSEELPPYQWDRPCPKCGAQNDPVRWQNRIVTTQWLKVKFPDGRDRHDDCSQGRMSEHLERRCNNCHYQWCEALAKPEEQTTATVMDSLAVFEAAQQAEEYDGDGNKRIYPCADCGKMRSKAEGGTVFTVCDECWEKHHAKA